MLIVTNIRSFPREWTAGGSTGRTALALTARDFLQHRHDADAVFLVNCAARLVTELATRQSLPFASRRPLIALDIVFLRKPESVPARLSILAKRLVLRNVDYFLHYFRDLSGLDSVYGIGADRSGFVDFKANLWSKRADGAKPDGDDVLCFGRSVRDFDTFFDAMEGVQASGAITDPRSASLWKHGSKFTRPLSALPSNVRVLEDDQSANSQAEMLEAARIVVVPMLRGRLIAAGISTILNAMLLGKCVIATAGPGVTDLFDRELISVPPEDPKALASAITRLWNDHDLRRRTAQAGWEYAQRCGSEDDFNHRVISAVVEWSRRARS